MSGKIVITAGFPFAGTALKCLSYMPGYWYAQFLRCVSYPVEYFNKNALSWKI